MKRWLQYAKPYWGYFVLGPLCMIVEVVGEVLLPRFQAQIIDQGIEQRDTGYILLFGLIMVVTAVCMMFGGVGGSWFGAKASVNFASDLRRDVYHKVQQFSFANLDTFSTGSLVTRLTNDITQIQNFINMLLRMCLRSPGMLIGALIMSVSMNPKLAVVLAVVIPLVLITQVVIIGVGFPRFTKMQTRIDQLNNRVQENITNMRVVKSFVREDFEKDTFQTANRDLKAAGMKAMSVMITMQPLMMLFMNTTLVVVAWFGGRQVIFGEMSVGDLTAFITYISQILMSLNMLTMLFMTSSRALASGKRITQVLDEPIDLTDTDARCKDAVVQNGEIEFKNVSFRYYKNNDQQVLDTINLKIEAGQTVGIIGSTGCGKTTLVSLIPRLYDADAGEVLIGGINVKDYTLTHLRDGVGMVLQKNVLFSGTIEENLRWGDENAEMDEIVAAADSAQADTFVKNFTKGYQTQLGQGGTNVSGGQKQRLCIARALLKKPKILILDDSTSAVDTATEARIRHTFRHALQGTTKIIIAQRILSVMDADKIIVMNEGKITGIGTHQTLLASNAEYREIYDSQMQKEEA